MESGTGRDGPEGGDPVADAEDIVARALGDAFGLEPLARLPDPPDWRALRRRRRARLRALARWLAVLVLAWSLVGWLLYLQWR